MFFPSLLYWFSRGGEKDTTTVPGCVVVVVVVVVARVGIPIPSMSVRHAACSSRGTTKNRRREAGCACVRACVCAGILSVVDVFFQKKITFRIFQRQKSHAIFSKTASAAAFPASLGARSFFASSIRCCFVWSSSRSR